jgi:hypothetical protein
MSWNSIEKLERDVEQAMRNLKVSVMQQVVEQRDGLVTGSIDLAIRNGGVREMKLHCSFNRKVEIVRVTGKQ